MRASIQISQLFLSKHCPVPFYQGGAFIVKQIQKQQDCISAYGLVEATERATYKFSVRVFSADE